MKYVGHAVQCNEVLTDLQCYFSEIREGMNEALTETSENLQIRLFREQISGIVEEISAGFSQKSEHTSTQSLGNLCLFHHNAPVTVRSDTLIQTSTALSVKYTKFFQK